MRTTPSAAAGAPAGPSCGGASCGDSSTANPADLLPEITRQYPTNYGKVQDKNPARFLTYDEAFGKLVGSCQDGTEAGLRDEIIIRLGLRSTGPAAGRSTE